MIRLTKLNNSQWLKVLHHLWYSFGAGFVGGFALAASGAMSALLQHTGTVQVSASVLVGLVVAGVVSGLNALAMTISQLFTND